jgi:hypothetical protein
MCEGEAEVLVESFAFLLKQMVHRARARGGIMVMLSSGVGVIIKGCFL